MRPSCPIYASRSERCGSLPFEDPSPKLCETKDCPNLSSVRLVSDAGGLLVERKDKLEIQNLTLRSFEVKYPRSGALMYHVECKEEGSVYRSREV